ncbi:MAG: VPLPA-CTERM sorting domain-containing protein [Rhodobacteraceae bacterium]|nr:VPLPA-CTERM sorting domain-containing protein [Paracoccaceae bacterium]
MRIVSTVAFLFFTAGAASAVPIAASGTEGLKVIATGGEVVAKYEGNTAAYTNLLYLDNGNTDFTDDLFIFNNQASVVGSTANLGSFTAGTELLFRLFVTNTGNNFFTGPASRNPDDEAHARVQADYLTPGTTLVSFEDLLNGPFVFNDLSFRFTNTSNVVPDNPSAVPLPAGFGLLAAGLFGLGLLRRKRA